MIVEKENLFHVLAGKGGFSSNKLAKRFATSEPAFDVPINTYLSFPG